MVHNTTNQQYTKILFLSWSPSSPFWWYVLEVNKMFTSSTYQATGFSSKESMKSLVKLMAADTALLYRECNLMLKFVYDCLQVIPLSLTLYFFLSSTSLLSFLLANEGFWKLWCLGMGKAMWLLLYVVQYTPSAAASMTAQFERVWPGFRNLLLAIPTASQITHTFVHMSQGQWKAKTIHVGVTCCSEEAKWRNKELRTPFPDAHISLTNNAGNCLLNHKPGKHEL